MKNTVVFDLDGTLVHTSDSLGRAMNMLLERMDRGTLDDEHVRAFIGNGARKLVSRTFEYFGITDSEMTVDDGVEHFFECYWESCLDVTVYPELEWLIDTLNERGIALCVLSNKPDRFVRPIVEHAFGKGKFLFAQGAREGIPHKPDTFALLDMLSRVGSDTKYCVFVGDSEVDVETAHRAGCKCCAVDWGYRSHEVLSEAGAQAIASDARELLSMIDELFALEQN